MNNNKQLVLLKEPLERLNYEDDYCTIIEGKLFLGSYDAAQNKCFCDDKGIKVIVNISFLEHYDSFKNVKYYNFGIYDKQDVQISNFFDETYNTIEKHLELKEPVLVHCIAGVSRSPTIIISYLMKKNGWGFRESFLFVKKKRKIISPNIGFKKQLKEYENQLNKKI